jgi:hypothetical protein
LERKCITRSSAVGFQPRTYKTKENQNQIKHGGGGDEKKQGQGPDLDSGAADDLFLQKALARLRCLAPDLNPGALAKARQRGGTWVMRLVEHIEAGADDVDSVEGFAGSFIHGHRELPRVPTEAEQLDENFPGYAGVVKQSKDTNGDGHEDKEEDDDAPLMTRLRCPE